jgi:hypothetical protein
MTAAHMPMTLYCRLVVTLKGESANITLPTTNTSRYEVVRFLHVSLHRARHSRFRLQSASLICSLPLSVPPCEKKTTLHYVCVRSLTRCR